MNAIASLTAQIGVATRRINALKKQMENQLLADKIPLKRKIVELQQHRVNLRCWRKLKSLFT